MRDWSAGRSYARVYPVGKSRGDLHAFLMDAVQRSGGRVLYASEPTRAPVFLGVQGARDERIGLLIYPFRMTRVTTAGRPSDEVRGQIRYGGGSGWHTDDHAVGRDTAGVDTTLMVGVHLETEVFIGVDPSLYDPIPMGISMYAKESQLAVARADSWHVWERENRAGSRRAAPRAQGGLEVMVAFIPERLLDYARFERQAGDLGLDPPLRFTSAQSAGAQRAASAVGGMHPLAKEFALTSEEILEIIAARNRLTVAVRGGVAEYHLEKVLRADPAIASAVRLDKDAQPDFDVTSTDGRKVFVEYKNASPEKYASGEYKVEVQKTRASKGDPASRLYRTDQFDVVAACLYPPTQSWIFRYRATRDLVPDTRYADRIKPLQRVDSGWSLDLAGAV
ncbi:MAG: hypothetical protein JO268_01200 [Pseudonocardiales bacterium]|nr:hypothetical protein [Pseudonocardiales bacterium]